MSILASLETGEDILESDVGQDRPMNILLLYADDWRYDTLGVAGNPIVKTPVLDALSQEGVRFTENCVTTSICWVFRVRRCTRVSIWLGMSSR